MQPARRVLLVAATASALGAGTANAFDPATEAQNYSKINERSAIYTTVDYQQRMRAIGTQEGLNALAVQTADPERSFTGDLCWSHYDGCGGDFRLYDWQASGYGIVEPVLYTARSGATISGHVWATRAGPAQRPGVVITNGSVQATEQLYWPFAQTLAKAGYVVLTWDPQGQGQSDTRGATPDEDEGFPAQSDGRPFYDGTADALDFFFSTAARPYVPPKSCSSGTSHDPKQRRRVADGLNAAHNPFAALLDNTRVGVAGHSFGAAGVSYVGQRDPRVKAIVAWDNLDPPDAEGIGGAGSCPGNPGQHDAAAIVKPALGMAADYYLAPTPYTADPDPASKSATSLAYTAANVDTGQINIRGGTHYEFSFIPNPAFGATLRGADLVAWYTTAWFDKYVKGDAAADARLLTGRWRADGDEAAVDPGGDGNMYSFYFPSRLDIALANGGRLLCEDLRAGCPGTGADDGVAGRYDYLSIATSPDSPPTAPGVPTGTAGLRYFHCTGRARIVVGAPRRRGVRVTRTAVYSRGRRVGSGRGRSVKVKVFGLTRGRATLVVRTVGRKGRRKVTHKVARSFRTCAG